MTSSAPRGRSPRWTRSPRTKIRRRRRSYSSRVRTSRMSRRSRLKAALGGLLLPPGPPLDRVRLEDLLLDDAAGERRPMVLDLPTQRGPEAVGVVRAQVVARRVGRIRQVVQPYPLRGVVEGEGGSRRAGTARVRAGAGRVANLVERHRPRL